MTSKDMRLRRDAGSDTLGNIRNISRNIKPTDILTEGVLSELSWPDICKCLEPKSSEENISINLLDTAIFEDNKVILWLYTNSNGQLVKKPKSSCSLARIREEFLNLIYKQTIHSSFFAILHVYDSEPTPIELDDFDKIYTGEAQYDIQAMQAFIPARGNITNYRSFRTNCWLDRQANFIVKTRKLDIDRNISGSAAITSKLSMNKALNEEMRAICHRVVTRIEHCNTCRVAQITCEFVQDSNECIWLVRAFDCTASYDRQNKRSISPVEAKQRRQQFISNITADPTHTYPTTATAAPMKNSPPNPSPPMDSSAASVDSSVTYGSYSDHAGRRARRKETSIPSDDEIEKILKDSSRPNTRKRPKKLTSLNPTRPASSENTLNRTAPAALPQIPNGRLSGDVPLVSGLGTAVLGSSQLSGCQGDFCNYDFSFIQRDLGDAYFDNPQEFRKKLMKDDQRLFSGDAKSHLAPYYASDIAARSKTATQLLAGGGEGGGVGGRGRKRAAIVPRPHRSSLLSLSPDKSHAVSDDEGGGEGGDPGVTATRRIPFRVIIQAKQEMQLVKLLLDRRRRGDGEGDYVSEESYQDLAISAQMPSHYYKDVDCCNSCFKIYSYIEQARSKAIKKIAAKKANANKSQPTTLSPVKQALSDISKVSVQDNSPDIYSTITFGSPSQDSLAGQSYFENDGYGFGGSSVSMSNNSLSGTGTDSRPSGKKKGRRGGGGARRVSYLQEGRGGGGTGQGLSSGLSNDPEIGLQASMEAIDSLTNLDVAEIRTMIKPPAAVEVVIEAVMALLLGKAIMFSESRRLLSGGESFLAMLRDFRLEDVTDTRLKLVDPYVSNPLFRPENVAPVSYCASKFCAWVLGVVQAARWQNGHGHRRTNLIQQPSLQPTSTTSSSRYQAKPNTAVGGSSDGQAAGAEDGGPGGELTFMQKLERKKRSKNPSSNSNSSVKDMPRDTLTRQKEVKNTVAFTPLQSPAARLSATAAPPPIPPAISILSRETPTIDSRSHSHSLAPRTTSTSGRDAGSVSSGLSPNPQSSQRQRTAAAIAQKRAAERLAGHSSEGASAPSAKTFRCNDGITTISYITMGAFSSDHKRCSFIVLHDFFDTCDATSILFKPLVLRHAGCQVLCLNYPGQANTVWPRPSAAERQRGAREPILNNDWLADRLHELVQYCDESGDIIVRDAPFHLLGFGNGSCIAAAFAQRWGSSRLYASTLRSVVSVNGFLSPDPQLAAILHSASQVFESTPHNRPDIPVSFWSRFVFSEDYLSRINPNLALNIYTAVSNPITADGRARLTRGSLLHRDVRGGLAPDAVLDGGDRASEESGAVLQPVQVPVIVLQCTEDLLVNAANVDPFLVGRRVKHLWSHQQNILTDSSTDISGSVGWVGRRSSGPTDYARNSILGKSGLRMLLSTISDPRGAFVMWVRSGHIIQQENKTALLDFLDALAYPAEEYFGVRVQEKAPVITSNNESMSINSATELKSKKEEETKKMDVMFKLAPPKRNVRKPAPKGKENVTDDEKTEEAAAAASEGGEEEEVQSPAPAVKDDQTSAAAPVAAASLNPAPLPPPPTKYFLDFTVKLLSQSLSTFGEPSKVLYCIELSSLLHCKSNRLIIKELIAGSVIVRSRAYFDSQEEVDRAAAILRSRATLVKLEKGLGGPLTVDDIDTTGAADPVEQSSSQTKETAPALVHKVSQGTEKVEEEEEEEEEEEPVEFEVFSPQMASSSKLFPAESKQAKDTKPEASQRADSRSGYRSSDRIPSPDEASIAETEAEAGGVTPTPQLFKSAPIPELPPRIVNNPKPNVGTTKLGLSQSNNNTSTDKVDSRVAKPSEASSPPEDSLPVRLTRRSISQSVLERGGGEVSSKEQRQKRQWADTVPTLEDAREVERLLALRKAELEETEARLRALKLEEEGARLKRLQEGQAERNKKYEEEDKALIASLESELAQRRKERLAAERQRRLEVQELEKSFVKAGVLPPHTAAKGRSQPVEELPPLEYDEPRELPPALLEKKDVLSLLDNVLKDEAAAKRRGGNLSMEDYEMVKRQMALRQMERDERLRHVAGDEQESLYNSCAKDIQRTARGFVGRRKAKRVAAAQALEKKMGAAARKVQALGRGYVSRKKTQFARRIYLENIFKGKSAVIIQRIWRGVEARKNYRKLMRKRCAGVVQRVFRGHLGRLTALKERQRLEALLRKERSAALIQSVWRMKVAKEEFRSVRIHVLAAIEIQRLYRGHLGRKQFDRRRKWAAATPGPERIKLGLKLIEESKVAFERQQEEIDALHRAQERAEARVSHIFADLKESEKELLVISKELQEIDHIERDLQTLTHERDILSKGITDAAGMPRIGAKAGSTVAEQERKQKAEAYALEMTIQIKRAEREKKRQELETEFATVFRDVEKKKVALERLETSLADMESTRERKDREFRRLQRNLMQLLMEQKHELDDLREKGIELETATATTAAAATATAMKAKEHEKRSTAMFSQTEELMKFQFMSMSLSYFSSLNMLKQLRDMNADTTSAAITSSADAAAAAAAAATAANLPKMRKLDLGAGDFVELGIQKKRAELASLQGAEKETKKAKASPLPDQVRLWSVDDVCRWLSLLSLNQYIRAFQEATVDGPFLMELREEDLVQVLGVEHKLHVRKILVSREKLKPLTEQERAMKSVVEREDQADSRRKMAGIPDIDTVFSQARNGRIKRLEESINLGFPVDAENSNGNTLLLVAAQNSNKRMVELLLARGAAINHQNTLGNTALHFAMAFDSDGLLGEYLIEHGADDTIENADGLTPYDGIGVNASTM